MLFHPKKLKSENNNPWFSILLHTQWIICATVFRVLGIYNFEPTPKLVSHVVHVFQREVVEKRLTIFRRALYTSEKDPWPMISWVFGTISTILIYDGIDTFYDKKWLTASEILSISQLVHIVVIRSVLYC